MNEEMKEEHITEMINIWHLSKCVYQTRHERMIYTKNHTSKKYPEYSPMKIYKTLDRTLN